MGVQRDEVEAAVEARRELGKAYEDEIVDSLVTKIERRLAERPTQRPARQEHRSVTPLALGSMFAGVAATAIAVGNEESWVALVAWIAIVIVNVAYALRR
jgi:hypothetical protein